VHRALRTRLALWPAIGLSSTIFGLAHWGSGDDLSTVVPRIFAGMMLALLLERTGSLYPGIVAHAYVDAGVLGLYVPSVQPLILLVLVLALTVAVAVSVDDDRRKKHGRPGPIARAQAGSRERGLQDRVRATGRLGGL
jgi:membrane protease YdiL (CAAX protease family)